MSSITTKKIKGAGIIVPEEKKAKQKKFPGYKLFNMPLFTCAIVASSMSGKTTLIRFMLEHHLLPKQKAKKYKVFIFCSTIHRDKKWQDIIAMIKKRGFEVSYGTDFTDLDQVVDDILEDRFEYPFKKYFIISDDMGSDNHCKGIMRLAKQGRHAICSLINIHDPTDLMKPCRKNVHVWLMLRNLPKDVLESVYESVKPGISLDEFIDLYNYARSKGDYDFLYYDKVNAQFRVNFDEIIEMK